MFIGAAAKKTGLSIKAIRFYESIGLVRKLERCGKYRIFSQSDIEVLELIRESRKLGVPLSRLQGVIQYKNGQIDWQEITGFLDEIKRELMQKALEIESNIAQVEQCINSITSCPK